MGFSVELEAMALVILLVIGLFHYDKTNAKNRKYQWFNTCLIVSACAIVSNLITCVMLEDVSAYPIGLHMFANSIYFIAINSCMSLVASYIFYLVFGHLRDRKYYKATAILVISMYVLLIALVLVNLWTGCYFYFENDQYCRGPLNRLSFLVITLEVILFCVYYVKNRKLVTPYAGHLIRTMPPLVLVMTLIQILFPDMIMTGTIAAMVNLIVFACFQNNRIGRDALTELPNRSSFFRELNYHKKAGDERHVILVHLCHLNKLDKRFSMKVGDQFIYSVARYLENLDGDYQVYRYGNTHFMMFGAFSDLEEAKNLADEIYERFAKPWDVQGEKWIQQIQLIHMSLSQDEMDENLLTDRLNYLLNYSKDKNYSTKLFFDEELKGSYERKRYVLGKVKDALAKESFVLNFQPVYSCKDKKYVSAEVLLRLYEEDGTLISPGEFIPIAEENGLTDAIGWFVLKSSMDFIQRYPKMPLESISINMSIEQMKKPYLDEKLKGVEELYISLMSKLRVEITENTIAENPALVTKVMQVLVGAGLNFYLDDFGMGYSNFSRVFSLPFELVKLDRSLVEKIDQDEKSFRIVQNLVDMLHNAGFMVLAEGVERKTQVDCAEELGVDRIQGFYFARPMNEQALAELLQMERV